MGQQFSLLKRQSVYVSNSKVCKGKGLFAKREFKKGDVVYEFEGELIEGDLTNVSNPYVLQIDFNLYILPEGEGRYLNHSCDPNCKLVLENNRLILVAIKDIKEDEELTYNYNTSEFDLGADSFECSCNANNCIKFIKGFKYLNKEQKEKIKEFLLPYLRKLI